ncbi:hypothetical protein AB0465_14705 [Streptomyces griseoviridis]|uniref:hypothetical protein n=1 Tax=Streptomyces griseoviridis TaxID=45398 RepID=UPI00344B29EB
MEPLTPGAVRAASVVTKAAISRYRPAGVARVGSAEDRAQSYRRFLDAIAHVIDTQVVYFYRRRDAEAVEGRRHRRLHARPVDLREDTLGNYNQAQREVRAALLGIRLCAPAPVLAAAEDLVATIPRFYARDTKATLSVDDFATEHDQCAETKSAFLDAARRDLAYNPRPWQLIRKYKERKYREQATRE